MRKHTRARSGKHSMVYIHTLTLPVTAHVSISKTPLPLGPRPHTHDTHLLQAFPKCRAVPPFPGRDNTAQGEGAFPRAPSPDLEAPVQSQAWPPLPIQQVLQVLRAVLLGARAEPGCPGCR